MTLYRGDDTNAFGNKFLTIELENDSEDVINKAEFQCGTVLKVFDNPVFPIDIVLTKDETKKLRNENVCFLRLYDEDGLRQTCEGRFVFETKQGVINAR